MARPPPTWNSVSPCSPPPLKPWSRAICNFCRINGRNCPLRDVDGPHPGGRWRRRPRPRLCGSRSRLPLSGRVIGSGRSVAIPTPALTGALTADRSQRVTVASFSPVSGSSREPRALRKARESDFQSRLPVALGKSPARDGRVPHCRHGRGLRLARPPAPPKPRGLQGASQTRPFLSRFHPFCNMVQHK